MAQWETGLEKLQAAYKAWHDTKGQSIDTWLALLSDDVDFRSLGGGHESVPWTRRCSTCAEVRGYLEGLTADFTMQYYRVDRFVCQDDHIVMIGATAWRHNKSGKVADTPKVDVWRFRDGKAVAFFEYFDTAQLFATAAG